MRLLRRVANDENGAIGQGAASFTDATCVMRARLLDKAGSAFLNGQSTHTPDIMSQCGWGNLF